MAKQAIDPAVPSPETAARPYHQLLRGGGHRVVSSGARKLIDTLLMLLFPSEPLARAAAKVGQSYALFFCITSLLYVGSIACFASAQALTHHVFFFMGLDASILMAWVLTVIGPILSLPMLALLWLRRYFETHEDLDLDRPLSMTSLWLVLAHIVLQVALFALTTTLRRQLVNRDVNDTNCNCCMACTWCCPSCAMASALHGARSTQPGGGASPSELPAYIA